MIYRLYDAEELARSPSEGFYVKDHLGSVAYAETKNTRYELHFFKDGTIKAKTYPQREGGRSLIPELSQISLEGSTWGGSMLKVGYVGVGMHLEFCFNGKRYLTSPIEYVLVYKDKPCDLQEPGIGPIN